VFHLQTHSIRIKHGSVSDNRDTGMLTGQTAWKPDKDVDWIDLIQDSDKWRAVVNTVMKFPVR